MNRIELIKELRRKTSLGLKACKNALEETGFDVERAFQKLAETGVADSILARPTTEGRVMSYIHAEGRVGVLLQVNCETDFVSRGEEFKAFMHEVCLQIAATNPIYVSADDIPADAYKAKEGIFFARAQNQGKPRDMIAKIIVGQIKKWQKEICLLDQPWVKDGDRTIGDMLAEISKQTKENVRIVKFSRFEAGVE